MAVAYLNEGATSLAAANWSDSTGFANDAELVINKPGSQSIQTALDQSAIGGINSLDILAPFSGVIGGTGGSLRVDADSNGTAYSASAQQGRVRIESGTIYYAATGGSTLAHLVQVGGSGRMFVTGGIVDNVHAYGGQYNISDQVTFGSGGTIYLTGGTGVIESHASDLADNYVITGGSHTIKRGATSTTGNIRIKGGNVTLDLGTAAIPIIYLEGGTLTLISAAAPDANSLFLLSGVLDLRQINTAISVNGYTDAPSCQVIGYGNPKFVLGGTRVPIGTGAKFVS